MSLEVISKVLSPTNATYVNGVSAERRFSAAVLANLYQRLVEKDGRGVNDEFVSSDDAQSSAQVFVNRILPVKIKPREQGANKNGASYSANKHYVQTETVGIEILTVLDDVICIPRARQDMIKTDLLAEQTKIYSDRLNTILNGATAAAKVLATYVAKANGESVNEKIISTADITNKVVLDRFIEANSLLDEGDSAHGIDIFPDETRIAVFKVSYRAPLKTSGVFVIGGANYAYDIAKSGAVSTEAKVNKSEDGYIGEIDGVPCHLISNESLAHASEFLGFADNELKENDFIGYVSSSYANARGVSTAKQTKIVDDPDGQGIRLQPYTKFGVISWYPKGNVILTKAEFNPFGAIKTLFTGYTSRLVFKLKGAGSRLFPVALANSFAFDESGKATVTGVTALDDWSTDHLLNNAGTGVFAYIIGAAPITTVGEFLKAGTAKIGTLGVKTDALTANQYITTLFVADDGSCSLFSKQYLAA